MVDRPRSHLQRSGPCFNPVGWTEMREIESVREYDVGVSVHAVRRKNHTTAKMRRHRREIEGRIAAEPRPQKPPPLYRAVLSEAAWRRNLVARRVHARAALSPAPA